MSYFEIEIELREMYINRQKRIYLFSFSPDRNRHNVPIFFFHCSTLLTRPSQVGCNRVLCHAIPQAS